MIHLVRAEVGRLLSRRLLRVLGLLAWLALILTGVLVFVNTESLSTEQLEARRGRIAELAGRCLDQEQFAGDVPAPPPAACQSLAESTVDDRRFKVRDLDGILAGTTAPLVVAAWLMGASFIGADWQSRTVTTVLTWEPRRVRVLVAKALACVVVTAALAVVLYALIVAALLPSALAHGDTSATGGGWLRSVFGVVLRGTGLVAVAAVLGFSVASIGRNTAAALGIGFAYFVIVENVVGGLLAGFRRWLLLGNAVVLVSGESGGGDVAGRSVLGAAVFLAAVSLAVFAGATAIFQRRDVP